MIFRALLVILIPFAFLLLPSAGYGYLNIASPDSPQFGILKTIPLPSGYENCSWYGAVDFAALRDKGIPGLKSAWTPAIWTLDAAMACLFAAGVGEGAFAALGSVPGAEIVRTTLTNIFEDVGLGMLFRDIWSHGDPDELAKRAKQVSDELGISDHYVIGLVTCPITRNWKGSELVPLGARVRLEVMPKLKLMPGGPTPDMIARIGRRDFRLVCLKERIVDLQALDARIWEEDLFGKEQPVTVKRVFAYEKHNGERIPSSGKPLCSLPVYQGGRIGGQAILESISSIELGGVREFHVSSPVNAGVLAPKEDIDDYIFVVVVNQDTVEVEGVDLQTEVDLKSGKELEFRVRIKGFHNGPRMIKVSDGREHPWTDLANAIFEGAVCEEAGGARIDTRISHHDTSYTSISCKPRREGKVKLVLQTLGGPVPVKTVQVVRKAEETTQLTEPKAAPSTEPTVTQGKCTETQKLGERYHQGCLEMRNDYVKLNCEDNHPECALEPRGCYGYIITNALPCEGRQGRIGCGTKLLDNYYTCVDGCNKNFIRLRKTKIPFDLKRCADGCDADAKGALGACDGGAINPPNEPTLAALPTSRLPGSDSSSSLEASRGTPPHIPSQTSPKAPPSESPAPPVPRAEPGVTAKLSSNFSDEFDGTNIDSRWKVVTPNRDSSIRMTGNGGLRITASPKEGGSDFAPGPNCNAPRVLQPVTGDWTMETRFNFTPTSRFQGAGIVVCFDQNPESRNCWRAIERQFWGSGQIVNFSGNEKRFSSNTTYLRLRKKGTSYTAWFSADGKTWTEAGTREESKTPIFVGIMTTRQPHDRNLNLYSVADFDYLRITQN